MNVKLILTSRNKTKLEDVSNRLKATAVIGDITAPILQEELLEVAKKQYGRCDILINNAGTLELGTKVRETVGAYAGTKYAIEALSEDLRMELSGTRTRIGDD